MTVVAIVNQKDGVGKTTLAWSLARTGTMLLVNAGPQGSARDWNHFNITGPEGLFVQSHPTCSSCADAIPCLSNPPTAPTKIIIHRRPGLIAAKSCESAPRSLHPATNIIVSFTHIIICSYRRTII